MLILPCVIVLVAFVGQVLGGDPTNLTTVLTDVKTITSFLILLLITVVYAIHYTRSRRSRPQNHPLTPLGSNQSTLASPPNTTSNLAQAEEGIHAPNNSQAHTMNVGFNSEGEASVSLASPAPAYFM